jgi:type IV secretory pathway TrbL component
MRSWSVAAKLLVVTLVLLMLSIGFRGTGRGFEGGGTPAQQARTQAGMVCLILCGLSFFATIVAAVIDLTNKGDR